MRTNFLKIGLQCLALVFLMGLFACEGDIGPAGSQGVAGPTGPPGLNGQNGLNGEDGQNGAENCIDCHGSNQLITAKVFQWENSVHLLGGHYERNTASCAGCHTSQGFLDRLVTGEFVASQTISDPLPINCYTCHQVHQTYTGADWALTAEDPAFIWINGETVDIGQGNLCLNCHQPRIPSDGVPAVGETGDYTIESTRYGPHHGAQGTMFLGVGKSGLYEIGEGYENSFHTNVTQDGCIQCHLAEVDGGREVGGHTFRVVSAAEEGEEGDLNVNACNQCHTNEDELEDIFAATQTEIGGLLDELAVLLRAEGILRADANRSVPGTYDAVTVGCYFNYISTVEDQSGGIHNYKYAKTLLENSIAALQ
jgi:hypothetical protein